MSTTPGGLTVEVLEGGLLTTLQDLGRSAGRRYGLPPGGALDQAAHAAANTLVQNSPDAATLEITLQGPRLLFHNPVLIALTGANLGPTLNERPVPMWMSVFVRPGQILDFGSGAGANREWGGRAYLGVHGGWAGPLVLGSRSTFLKAGLGGYEGLGRSLQAGDRLRANAPHLRSLPSAAGRLFPPGQRLPYSRQVAVRVVPGPYQEHFRPEAYDALFSSIYQVSDEFDRMGMRLRGPVLTHRGPDLAQIPACGAVFGAIQVPANGQPIVLMADHQVTGGYPIIGTVLSVDLPLLAQLTPGDEVRMILNQS